MKQFVPQATPFSISNNTAYTIDKTQMMYTQPTEEGLEIGHVLILTFTYDTELVLVPDTYSSSLLFEMGFV
jgi:hypothetical protein